jgi:DNA-binding NarL/FixJ family response regulator
VRGGAPIRHAALRALVTRLGCEVVDAGTAAPDVCLFAPGAVLAPVAGRSSASLVLVDGDAPDRAALAALGARAPAACLDVRSDPRALGDALGSLAAGTPPTNRSRRTTTRGRPVAGAHVLDGLTARERDVLDRLAAGASVPDIAAATSISPNTVRTHVQNVLVKLQVGSRVEAVSLVRRARLAAGDPPAATAAPSDGIVPAAAAGCCRVVVADGRSIERAAMTALLADRFGLEVAAEAADVPALVEAVKRTVPDVSIVDAGLERGGGIQGCARVKFLDLATRVVVVTDDADADVLQEAVQAGADGYLTRRAEPDDFRAAVERVAGGEPHIPTGMLGGLLRGLISYRRAEDAALERFSRLTPAERRVLALLVDGLGHDGIGAALHVSPHTARTHIQHLLRKLDVHSRLEAVTLAMKYDLVERFGSEVSR